MWIFNAYSYNYKAKKYLNKIMLCVSSLKKMDLYIKHLVHNYLCNDRYNAIQPKKKKKNIDTDMFLEDWLVTYQICCISRQTFTRALFLTCFSISYSKWYLQYYVYSLFFLFFTLMIEEAGVVVGLSWW